MAWFLTLPACGAPTDGNGRGSGSSWGSATGGGADSAEDGESGEASEDSGSASGSSGSSGSEGSSDGSGTSSGSASTTSDPTTSAGTSTSGTSTTGGTTASSSTSSSGGDTDGLRFDVGTNVDIPAADDGGPMTGCSKVDFLFVVDNSGSMADEQANLVASFPGFISAIQTNLELEDFRILVVDTDASFSGGGGGILICSPAPSCCNSFCASQPNGTCNNVACTPPTPGCDGELGAGKVKDMAGNDCGVEGGVRYLVPTQTDLNGTFACLAEVGTAGSGDEQQAAAALTAIGPMNAPGACNEGFLRDDAILVVTIITDEEDGPNDGDPNDTNSPGNPATWRQALIDAKNGDENAVVMLGMVGDTGTPGAICTPFSGVNGAEDCAQLRQLADSFTYGQWASVCAADYAPFFAEAVSVIDSACDVFIPPG